MTDIAIIVLAAGLGTRMKSSLPKVLHKAANRSLLGHAISAANSLKPSRVVVVHGPDMDIVKNEALIYAPTAVLQNKQSAKVQATRFLWRGKFLLTFKELSLS